jgi:hypothetical protein
MTMPQFIVTCSLDERSRGVRHVVVADAHGGVPAFCDWSIKDRCALKCSSRDSAERLIKHTEDVHPNAFDFNIIEL